MRDETDQIINAVDIRNSLRKVGIMYLQDDFSKDLSRNSRASGISAIHWDLHLYWTIYYAATHD